jgi:ribosomal protein L25 (general stress protein Ctc)
MQLYKKKEKLLSIRGSSDNVFYISIKKAQIANEYHISIHQEDALIITFVLQTNKIHDTHQHRDFRIKLYSQEYIDIFAI